MTEQQVLPDAPGRDLSGALLGGRYRLGSVLGRGGMGVVYEAADLLLDRPVAVKVLRGDLATDPRATARFEREARTAASLSHPNVVAVYDVGTDGPIAWFVMERVAGRTVAQIVAVESPLDPARAAAIARQVADALAYAHARGVIHRDVAPGNVMVTPNGHVKVLDLGIARAERWTPPSHADTVAAHGTAAYLAPEQARGETDPRSDIYGLGAVLYEMLTGTVPSPKPTAIAGPLGVVVMRCLATDPDQRYRTADDLAAALGSGGNALPAGPPRTDGDASAAEAVTVARRRTPVLGATSTIPVVARPGRAFRWPRVIVVCAILAFAGWFVALPLVHALAPRAAAHGHRRATRSILLAPTAPAVTGSCDGLFSAKADLSWTPSSPSATGYDVYRAGASGGAFTLAGHVDGWRSAGFTDRGLGTNRSYVYVVRAVGGDRLSPVTSEVTAHTPFLCLG
jgi:hypothetical protein